MFTSAKVIGFCIPSKFFSQKIIVFNSFLTYIKVLCAYTTQFLPPFTSVFPFLNTVQLLHKFWLFHAIILPRRRRPPPPPPSSSLTAAVALPRRRCRPPSPPSSSSLAAVAVLSRRRSFVPSVLCFAIYGKNIPPAAVFFHLIFGRFAKKTYLCIVIITKALFTSLIHRHYEEIRMQHLWLHLRPRGGRP